VCDPYKIAEKAKTEPCLVYSIGSNGQVRALCCWLQLCSARQDGLYVCICMSMCACCLRVHVCVNNGLFL
jgi:hypothetical protein